MSVEAGISSKDNLVNEKLELSKVRSREPDNQDGPSLTSLVDKNCSPNPPNQIALATAPDNATTPKTPIPTDALRAPDSS
ncbi:hypothetical protein TWF730_008696 [Orbilia blumenaviensis]|uniref:Uncharacterized protein n=1 Tax=Orbilia blumenaviensis TaxID=1796055 RepID=A0AAV9V6X8_9PEZI